MLVSKKGLINKNKNAKQGTYQAFCYLFGIVSIYQLSFTFVTNKVEKQAEEFAINKISDDTENYVAKRETEETRYLDSVGNNTVFDIGITSFTYNEAKDKELNKGLDLKGGINVILEISVKDILKDWPMNLRMRCLTKPWPMQTKQQKTVISPM